ncbi:hypothetical protein AB4156_27090 [Cupriavidus sp. 2MCAB6]|uniref:hypothetical protein n=1 Tax=Cupriavidus sp. 2MCAB6 TaxID=3232981 RepID=UPI003F9187BD
MRTTTWSARSRQSARHSDRIARVTTRSAGSLPLTWSPPWLGSGTGGRADGAGPAASFRSPPGIAVDTGGNLYVADTGNYMSARSRRFNCPGNRRYVWPFSDSYRLAERVLGRDQRPAAAAPYGKAVPRPPPHHPANPFSTASLTCSTTLSRQSSVSP